MLPITPHSLAPSGTRVDLWLRPARAERYDPQSSTAFWGPLDGRQSELLYSYGYSLLVCAYTCGLCSRSGAPATTSELRAAGA